MRSIIKLLFFLVIPLQSFAQDTTIVKQQANEMAKAVFNGDYSTVIDHTYPKYVQIAGGKDTMVKATVEVVKKMKEQGVIRIDGSIGSPGKFYNAGSEIHCLVPEEIILVTLKGRFVSKSYLLAISGDKGKTWSFLDVGSMTNSSLHEIFPDFNDDLKVPEGTKPIFYSN